MDWATGVQQADRSSVTDGASIEEMPVTFRQVPLSVHLEMEIHNFPVPATMMTAYLSCCRVLLLEGDRNLLRRNSVKSSAGYTLP